MRVRQCVSTPERNRPRVSTGTGRFWRRPSLFKARPMATEDGTLSPLPAELDRALRGATDRTLIALTALRKAVRQHVQDERDGGASLEEIEVELRSIIARVLKDAAGRDSIDGERDALASQMLKWSEGFYRQQD
jgi:hypothetical protein